MTPLHFPGVTHIYKAPPDWDEKKNGPCADLPVRRTDEFATSRWWPTQDELGLLLRGGSVEIDIAGGQPAMAVRAVEHQ